MIAPNSASYPVRGAANAAGVDYARALAWVDAPDAAAAAAVASEIMARHGVFAWAEFHRLIQAAWDRGDLRIRRAAGRPAGDWR